MSEPTVHYSVYRRGTDEPVIIHGTAKQRHGKPGGSMKWEIYRDDEEDLDNGAATD